jgi:hypothetical protein
MHHEQIEVNFDASCQQILGLELEILWEAGWLQKTAAISIKMFYQKSLYQFECGEKNWRANLKKWPFCETFIFALFFILAHFFTGLIH